MSFAFVLGRQTVVGGLFLAVSAAAIAPSAAAGPVVAAEAAVAPRAGPTVSVVAAERRELVETAPVTGTLVARDEVLVFAETEGLRVIEILADEGDTVRRGDVLIRLSRDLLDAQHQQSAAALARAEAGVTQARTQIEQAEAASAEAADALKRTESLFRTGNATQATLDGRVSAARSTAAAVDAARSGLAMAQAAGKTAEAQLREVEVRLGHTEVRAPADGVVARRSVRLGQTAAAGAGDPLFRIVADGAVELEGEVVENRLRRIREGAAASVVLDGRTVLTGRVRLVSPEVDRTTRLGRVRIALPGDARLHVGGFARGTVELDRRTGVTVPLAATRFGPDGAVVQAVVDGRVEERRVETGLAADGRVEILSGIAAGETVVARAGGFLRDRDAVTPVLRPAEGVVR